MYFLSHLFYFNWLLFNVMWTVFQLFSWPEQVHVGKMMAIGNLDYKPEKKCNTKYNGYSLKILSCNCHKRQLIIILSFCSKVLLRGNNVVFSKHGTFICVTLYFRIVHLIRQIQPMDTHIKGVKRLFCETANTTSRHGNSMQIQLRFRHSRK